MKIVAIGDSITEGFPYSKEESWVAHVGRELNVEIINQGVCGELTEDMLKRFDRDVIEHAPSYVIILGGSNDAYAGYTLEKISTNFTAMVRLCREHDIKPIFGLPTPSLYPEEEDFLMTYREWIKSFSSQEKIPNIDFFSPFLTRIRVGQAKQLYVDEVHPTLEGYELMGETAVESLLFLSNSKY